jgi:hypothetical protein
MRTKQRLISLFAGLILSVAAGLGIAVTAASPALAVGYGVDSPVLIPDEGMYCQGWAADQLGNAVDVKFVYGGLSGSRSRNSMACRYAFSSGVGESYDGVGGLRWVGIIGNTPFYNAPINYGNLCHWQYGPETYEAWINVSDKYITANRSDDVITHSGWYCIGQPGTYYDQSSHL